MNGINHQFVAGMVLDCPTTLFKWDGFAVPARMSAGAKLAHEGASYPLETHFVSAECFEPGRVHELRLDGENHDEVMVNVGVLQTLVNVGYADIVEQVENEFCRFAFTRPIGQVADTFGLKVRLHAVARVVPGESARIVCGLNGEPMHAAAWWRQRRHGRSEFSAAIRVNDTVNVVEARGDKWRITRYVRRRDEVEAIPVMEGSLDTPMKAAGNMKAAVWAAIAGANGVYVDRFALDEGEPIDKRERSPKVKAKGRKARASA